MELRSTGEDPLWSRAYRLQTCPQLAGREDPGENAVKLFDWEILAYVTIGASPESSMHLVFIIADSGEHDNGQFVVHFADESDERNAIHFRHLKIDNHHFAVVMGQPIRGLKAVGEGFAGVTFLAEISDKEPGDGGIIVDD